MNNTEGTFMITFKSADSKFEKKDFITRVGEVLSKIRSA